jgi:lipopolysaccharide transport system ATP-binding protein
MARTIIKVENLGKTYRVGQASAERYLTLRDSVTSSWKGIMRRLGGGAVASETHSTNRGRSSQLWAVKDMSFEVKEGDVVGIIGRNGAGKSTLLKMLSRVTEPTTGRLRMRGRVATLLEVGTGFHPELTGRENIYLNGAICGLTRHEIRRRFDEIVAFSEVERSLDTPVKRYSSGMYLRLAFAVAAHVQAEVLIVDEVVAVGDLQFQKKCLKKMEDVAGEGKTVLFVSHQLSAVQALCTRALLMDGGQLVEDGTVESCVNRYVKAASEGDDAQHADLRERCDRLGSGVARFISCELLHESEESSVMGNSYMIGEAVGLRMTASCRDHLSGMVLGFSVIDMRGTVLFTSHISDYIAWDEMPAGVSSFESWIRPCYLPPGRYSIRLGVSNSGSLADLLSDAIHFEVDPVVGPHGRMPDGRPGLLQFDLPWQVLPQEEDLDDQQTKTVGGTASEEKKLLVSAGAMGRPRTW